MLLAEQYVYIIMTVTKDINESEACRNLIELNQFDPEPIFNDCKLQPSRPEKKIDTIPTKYCLSMIGPCTVYRPTVVEIDVVGQGLEGRVWHRRVSAVSISHHVYDTSSCGVRFAAGIIVAH